LGSGCVDSNAISKGKDVFVSLVLEGIWVHINDSLVVGDSTAEEFSLGSAGRVDDC
jgi:hypothetical protein